jgi:hypothetical protein
MTRKGINISINRQYKKIMHPVAIVPKTAAMRRKGLMLGIAQHNISAGMKIASSSINRASKAWCSDEFVLFNKLESSSSVLFA